jgi:arylsulfatase A-like enzyme
MLLVAMTLPVLLAGPARVDERPNVLIIMSDQHNPRYMGCAGHPSLRTPNLDRLASEGVRFRTAYSNAPVCAPARAATFYGKYPTELGLLANGFEIQTDGRHLSEHLADAGYATGLAGKSHILPRERGRKTFQWSYDLSSGVIAAGSENTPYARYLKKLFVNRPELFPDGRWRSFSAHGHNTYYLADLDNLRGRSNIPAQHYPANLITRHALGYIDEAAASEQPFFLFASYFIPHHPYYPPAPYDTLFDPDEVELPPNFHSQPIRSSATSPKCTEREWREIIALYSGLVTLLDEQVGALITRLEQHGILDDTLIVFVADHGDMMGEFGTLFKGRMEDASSRVPLLMRYGDRAQHGLVVDEPVEQVDIFATCLDAAGLEPPEGTRGRSLLELADGNVTSWKDYVYCASQGTSGNVAMLVRDRRYKFVLKGTRRPEDELQPYLFDMLADPFEMNDLAGSEEHSEAQVRLDGALRAWWQEQLALEPEQTTTLVASARQAELGAAAALGTLTELRKLSKGVIERFARYGERRAQMLARIETARTKGVQAWGRAAGRRATIHAELERMTRIWRYELDLVFEELDADHEAAAVPGECGALTLAVVDTWIRTDEPESVFAVLERTRSAKRALAALEDVEGRDAFLAAIEERLAATPGLAADDARAQVERWKGLFTAD